MCVCVCVCVREVAGLSFAVSVRYSRTPVLRTVRKQAVLSEIADCPHYRGCFREWLSVIERLTGNRIIVSPVLLMTLLTCRLTTGDSSAHFRSVHALRRQDMCTSLLLVCCWSSAGRYLSASQSAAGRTKRLVDCWFQVLLVNCWSTGLVHSGSPSSLHIAFGSSPDPPPCDVRRICHLNFDI